MCFSALKSLMLSLLLLTLFALSAGAQGGTTDTLRLTDLFTAQPGPGGHVTFANRYDLNGPVIVIPDTSAWRLPRATATPTPAPKLTITADIPRLPMLITLPDANSGQVQQPPFLFRGLSMADVPPGHAIVRFITETKQLRAQYQVRSLGEEDARPLIFLHGPETRESFALPAGSYQVEARFWRPDAPADHRLQIHPPMRLEERGIYEFHLTPGREQEILQGLR